MTNACYAMRVRLESGDEPGYEPRLLVSSHLRGQEVAVVVSDKGTGIIVDVTGRTNCRLSPLAIFERKGGRPAGFQGLSGANSTWRSGQNPRKSLVLPDLRGERPSGRRRRWPARSGGDSTDANRIAAPRSRTASAVAASLCVGAGASSR